MITLPSIQTKINTQALPAFMYVKPDHYVAVQKTSKSEKVTFGQFLPLSKRAAMQYIKATGHIGSHRVIMHKTAVKAGLI